MTETALGLVKAESFQVPALIADIGPEATKRYFEFFTVPIRNKNTRIAYYHAIGQFLDWCQRAGFRGLEDIDRNSAFMVRWRLRPTRRKHALEHHSGVLRRRW